MIGGERELCKPMALLNTVEKEAELKVTQIREKSEVFANGTQSHRASDSTEAGPRGEMLHLETKCLAHLHTGTILSFRVTHGT